MTDQKMIALPHVARRIAKMTGEAGPSPRKVYDLALRGAFPAEFMSGRWYIAERDLGLVAAALGLDVIAANPAI